MFNPFPHTALIGTISHLQGGGGVRIDGDSTVTIESSIITFNSVPFLQGGGLLIKGGSVTIKGSTISSNAAANVSQTLPF